MQEASRTGKKRSRALKWIAAGLLLILFAAVSVFAAAGLMPVKETVRKEMKSCYVPMKDGTRLAVRYILPSDLKEGEKVPAIMESTRYGTGSERKFLLKALVNLGIAHEIHPVELFAGSGYALVEADARGSGASFGSRDMEWSREEVEDMGRIIGWIARQPWSDGKVGTYGMSYSGNTAELAVASNHPALLAAAPLYPDFDPLLQAAMPGGIFNEVLIKQWSESVIAMDRDKSGPFYRTAPVDGDKDGKLLKQAIAGHHSFDIYEAFDKITYIDDLLTAKYRAGSIAPYNYGAEIQKSGVPLYVRVGWQDSATVNGAIERFLTYKNDQTLVIGPWGHAGWSFYDPFLESPLSRKELEKQQADELTAFFDSRLKGNGGKSGASNRQIKYYTLGEGKWKTTDTWPVAGFENRTLYFGAGGSLGGDKPAEASGKDSYRVDFTASTGEGNRWFTNMGGGPVKYPDRAGEDKKLLTYTGDALESDAEITGVPVVTLNVTSTATDGAFFVYLEDVAPDGKVTYITEGELRAIHRKTVDEVAGRAMLGPKHSYESKDGELLVPGENAELKIGMYATSVLIKKGHRIRIAIAGHDAANFRRIPEKGEPVIEVMRNSALASYVELPMRLR